MKRIIILIPFLLTLLTISKAQNQKINLTPDDIRNFENRTLVVELLEEEPALIKKYEKQAAKHPDKLDNYLLFINRYNEYIQSAFEKHWTLTSKLVFKTTSEIKELAKEKSSDYLILRFDNFGGGAYYTRRSYMLHKGEKFSHSYLFWLPVEFDENEVHNLQLYNISVVIQFIHKHLVAIEKANDNKLQVEDFILQQAKDNCGKMRSNRLIVPVHTIHNSVDVNVLRGIIGPNCEILPDSYVQKAYEEQKPNNMITVSFFVGNTAGVSLKRVIIGLDGTPYAIKDALATQVNRFTFDDNDIRNLYKCE